MRLTLIRHGQTPANVAGVLDTGAPGPGLTDLGLAQAAALPPLLGEREVGAVYVSRLVRTRLTAGPLAEARTLDRIELPGVHEIEAGDLERHGDLQSVREYMETVFAWGLGDLDRTMPGGPSGHDFFGRYDADIERVTRETDHPVVFSHGAAIRVWVASRATNIVPSFTAEHHLPNAGVVELEGSVADGWRLLAWPEVDLSATMRDPIDAEMELE